MVTPSSGVVVEVWNRGEISFMSFGTLRQPVLRILLPGEIEELRLVWSKEIPASPCYETESRYSMYKDGDGFWQSLKNPTRTPSVTDRYLFSLLSMLFSFFTYDFPVFLLIVGDLYLK